MARRTHSLSAFPARRARQHRGPLWRSFSATVRPYRRGAGASEPASATEQVRSALRQLPSVHALRSAARGQGLAGDLDAAMQRIGQLSTLISVLDGLRGLLEPPPAS